jgi:prevent-host-death family protein
MKTISKGDFKALSPTEGRTMTTTSISEARENLADLGNRVSVGHERIVVERRGKNLFALVPMEDLELLEQLEDKLDLDAIRAATNEPTVAWEKVKKQLGL